MPEEVFESAEKYTALPESSKSAWLRDSKTHSLSEVFASIKVPTSKKFGVNMRAFAGPGLIIAVGYMDPGNWATDIAGGSQFGYTLLSVILFSNFFAMILQYLSLKLGIVTGKDLAQACRDAYSMPIVYTLWILSEIAIAATDLAEVLGSAIALNLLFHIPLLWGVVITMLDVLVVLYLQNKSFKYIEVFVASLVFLIGACFVYQIIISKPEWHSVAAGMIPQTQIFKNPNMLYIAISILGATVMPHNLYLHSSIVQTRRYERNNSGKKSAIFYAGIDSTVSLFFAFFINAAILILASAGFHKNGFTQIAEITDAYKLLDPVFGVQFSSLLFAVALLAAGQNSTLTGTLSGQIVMEGFIQLKLKPWQRRLLTRSIAVVPAFFVIAYTGEGSITQLLVFSQIVISMQLSFAVIPLVIFTSSKLKMGAFVNSKMLVVLSVAVAAIILGLNAYLFAIEVFK